MTKKKILFVIPYMSEGGAQRALSNIQKELANTYSIDTLINGEFNRVYPNYGNVYTLKIDNRRKKDSVLFQFLVFLKRVHRLRDLKNTNDYIACISFVDSANVANIITKSKKTKTIISVRTSIAESAKVLPQYKYIVSPMVKLLYPRADRIITVSEELRRELICSFGINARIIQTIYNGFDIENINMLSQEDIDNSVLLRVKGKRIVFTAGRLNIAKNQWHLIRAFSIIKKKLPNTVLVIAGTGELEEYLQSLTEKLGLSKDIIFLGFESNVYRYMANADVFVLPSCYEGFPNALCEAMCVGAPCVVTDFKTGAREIIAPELLFSDEVLNKATECEYGIITPKCSGKKYIGEEPLESAELELADAITRVLEDERLMVRYRSKSRERSRFFTIHDAARKWEEEIEDKKNELSKC